MPEQAWKRAERIIARRYFGAERNQLSGRNSRDDQGKPRAGDVIYKPAHVEIKRLKKVAVLNRSADTRTQARGLGKPFIHIEVEPGDLYHLAIVVGKKDIHTVIDALRAKWEGEFNGQSEPSAPNRALDSGS